MSNPIIGRGWQFPPGLDERGNVALTHDDDEVEQSIRIILGTVPGQRVMRPDFCCRIHELVFAPNNTATIGMASRYVREALARWEPRIIVERIDVVPDQTESGRLLIDVDYRITGTHSNRSLVYPFYVIPEEGRQPIP
ncbi:MAG: baseplate protein [Chloroflexi bacterium RBG_19FT_COMBO_62_14]|nr:MAG: baseplate protein [Chloroflexi bacterium RBG_19FT_COMBO_62_14]